MTCVLRLGHVLEDVGDVPKCAEQPREVSVPLDTTTPRQRAELIDASIGKREVILLGGRPPSLEPLRPVERGEAADEREPRTLALDVEEVMLGAVELLVGRLRIQRRLTTEEALEHGMRQIVVLADGAGGKPVAESPAVGKAGKFRGRRRVAVGVEDVVRVDRHVPGVVPQARREVERLLRNRCVGQKVVGLCAPRSHQELEARGTRDKRGATAHRCPSSRNFILFSTNQKRSRSPRNPSGTFSRSAHTRRSRFR